MALFRFTPRRCLELQVSLSVSRFFSSYRARGFRVHASITFRFISRLFLDSLLVRNSKSAMRNRGARRSPSVIYGADSLSLSLSRPPARKKTPAGFRIPGWLRNSIDRCDKKTHPSADRGSGWTSEFVDRQIDARMAMDRSERSHRETGSSRLLQNEIEEFGKIT